MRAVWTAPLGALMLAALSAGAARADLADRKALTLEDARAAMAAAMDEARKNNWKVVIAVVDDGGRLITQDKMDGVASISVEIAPGKARTAALFARPSGLLEEAAKTRPAINTVPYILLQGGMPIKVNGVTIGAVGVSGVQSAQDEQIAKAGVNAIKGVDRIE